MKTLAYCFGQSMFFFMAIPALACCLYEISSKGYENFEEILENYSWFKSVLISYQKKTGKTFSFEEFDLINKFELAQLVLNSGSCNALMDFDNLLLGGMNSGFEESEEE